MPPQRRISDPPPDLDEQGRPVYNDDSPPPDLDDYGNPVIPSQPGFVHQVWSALNEPLTTAPTRMGKYLSEKMEGMPTFQQSGKGGFGDWLGWANASTKGFMQGATEGAGEFASGMTSPLNIGTTLATGGSNLALRAGLNPQVVGGISKAGKALGALTAGHGGMEMAGAVGDYFDPNTSLSDTAGKFGKGMVEAAGGIGAARHTPNVKGPIISRIDKNYPNLLRSMDMPEAPQIQDEIDPLLKQLRTSLDKKKKTPTPGPTPIPGPNPTGGFTPGPDVTVGIPLDPVKIKQLRADGYDLVGNNTKGEMLFRQVRAPSTPQPNIDPNLNNGQTIPNQPVEPTRVMTPEQLAKKKQTDRWLATLTPEQRHGYQLRESARNRAARGQLTPKEWKKAEAYKGGDTIQAGDYEGEYVTGSFGNVTIKLEDGTHATFPRNQTTRTKRGPAWPEGMPLSPESIISQSSRPTAPIEGSTASIGDRTALFAQNGIPPEVSAKFTPAESDLVFRHLSGEQVNGNQLVNTLAKHMIPDAPRTAPVGELDPITPNASGESMASQEAINRQNSMKSQGQQFVVFDRAGNMRPLIGPEAVDYQPRPGETYGVMGPDGFQTLTDNGGRPNQSTGTTPHQFGEQVEPDTYDLGNLFHEIPRPETPSTEQPVTAVHKFDWPEFNEDGSSEPHYDIQGGPYDRSTVSGRRLDELGIPRPESVQSEPVDPRRTLTHESPLHEVDAAIAEAQQSMHPDLENLPYEEWQNLQPWEKGYISRTNRHGVTEDISPQQQAIVRDTHRLQEERLNRDAIDVSPVQSPGLSPEQFGEQVLPTERPLFEPTPESVQPDSVQPTEDTYDYESNPTPELDQPSLMQRFLEEESGEVQIGPDFGPDQNPDAVILEQKRGSPENVKRITERGYKWAGLTDEGDLIFNKSGEPAGPGPVLESEVTDFPKKKTRGEKQRSMLSRIYNIPRGMLASGDLSGPFRQGFGLVHKGAFWKNLPEMVKSWISEGHYEASQAEIKGRTLFRKRTKMVNGKETEYNSVAEEAGLKLTDLDEGLNKREEVLGDSLIEWVPGVRRSNRAYTTFLNRLRADTFDSLVKDSAGFGTDARTNVLEAKALANFVNVATGRGSLGSLEQSAHILSNIVFAPRLMAARMTMLNPGYYMKASPQVRQEALKSLFAMTAFGSSILGLGKLAGGEVSMDPSSSDFMKLKFGNTRIDPWGGYQQYFVAANRLFNPLGPATGFKGETPFTRGQMVTSSSNPNNQYDLWNQQGPFDPTWGDVAVRFARGKLHPVLGLGATLAFGRKELSGEHTNFGLNIDEGPMAGWNSLTKNTIAQRFMPIFLQDMTELAQSDQLSPQLKVMIGAATGLGMGQQTYGPKSE